MAASGKKEDDAIRKLFRQTPPETQTVGNAQLWKMVENTILEKKVKTEHDRYGFVRIINTVIMVSICRV